MKKIVNIVLLLFAWYSLSMDLVPQNKGKVVKLKVLVSDREIPATIHDLFVSTDPEKGSADIPSNIMIFLSCRDNVALLRTCKSFYNSVFMNENKTNELRYSFPSLKPMYIPILLRPFDYTKLLVFYSQKYNAISDEKIKDDCKEMIIFLCNNEGEEYKQIREQIFDRKRKKIIYPLNINTVIRVYGEKYSDDEVDPLALFFQVPDVGSIYLSFEQGCTLQHEEGRYLFNCAVIDHHDSKLAQLFLDDKREISLESRNQALWEVYQRMCNNTMTEVISIMQDLKVDFIKESSFKTPYAWFIWAFMKGYDDFVHPFIEQDSIKNLIKEEAIKKSLRLQNISNLNWECVNGIYIPKRIIPQKASRCYIDAYPKSIIIGLDLSIHSYWKIIYTILSQLLKKILIKLAYV